MATTAAPVKLSDLSFVHGIKHSKPPTSELESPAINGQVVLTKTISNILIHISDHVELQDLTVSCERSAELCVGVLLEGKLAFSLGKKEVVLEVLPGDRPQCFVFNMLYPVQWQRQLVKANHIKKVVISLSHAWLHSRFSADSPLNSFVKHMLVQHAYVNTLQTGHTLHRITQGIIKSGKDNASEIELEGQALSLLIECLKTFYTSNNLNNLKQQPESPRHTNSLRICRYIEQFIHESKPQKNIDLNQLAKDLGLSISTAQRQFKQDFKVTIMEYLRTQRLNFARDELLKGLSIGETAYIAGYTHVSNFSLAFKKYFGVSPGDLVKKKCSK